jgi:hypothetical protein
MEYCTVMGGWKERRQESTNFYILLQDRGRQSHPHFISPPMADGMLKVHSDLFNYNTKPSVKLPFKYLSNMGNILEVSCCYNRKSARSNHSAICHVMAKKWPPLFCGFPETVQDSYYFHTTTFSLGTVKYGSQQSKGGRGQSVPVRYQGRGKESPEW